MQRRRLGQLVFLLSMVFGPFGGGAFAGTVTAELNRTKGPLDARFFFTLTIEGELEEKIELPEVKGLRFERRGVQNSMFLSNGKMVRQQTRRFLVLPQKPGTYEIPSMELVVDGKSRSTLPLELEVQPPRRGGTQARSGGEEKQGNQADGPPGVTIEKRCSPENPYVGQQVLCTVRVKHRGNLTSGQKVPQSSSAMRQFSLKGERRTTQVENGQRVRVIEMREVVVPSEAGEVQVPPYTLDARVLTRRGDKGPFGKFFDRFQGGVFDFHFDMTREKEVRVASKPVPLHVKPLPETGKPADFSGLVGRFQVTAKADRREVKAGETVTLTVTVQGRGLLDGMAPLDPGLDKLGKVYPDKPKYEEAKDPNRGIRSRKTLRYALVPARSGRHDLGRIEVPVFNPRLEKYVTLRADLGELVVNPSDAEKRAPAPVSPKKTEPKKKKNQKPPEPGLVGLRRDFDPTESHGLEAGAVTAWAVVGGGPLGLAFLLMGWRWSRERVPSPAVRRREALRAAWGRFEDAQNRAGELCDEGEVVHGLVCCRDAFRELLAAYETGESARGAAWTADDVANRLQDEAEAGPPAWVAELVKSLRSIETAEYSGRAPEPATGKNLVAAVADAAQRMAETRSTEKGAAEKRSAEKRTGGKEA